MPWLLIDSLVAVLALVAVALVLLRVWRRLKGLSQAMSAASEAVGSASDSLAVAQAAGPSRR